VSFGDSDATSLCLHGCYWPCEHRDAAVSDAAPKAFRQAMPVHDELRRCRICGGGFYATADHDREHERLRALGELLPRYPRNWPVVLPRD
jgi:hypothetical protein